MLESAFYTLEGPLTSIPSVGQIRASSLSGFDTLVEVLDGNPRDILERHGLDASALRDRDMHVGVQQFCDLLEDCGSRFDEPLFGLRLAAQQAPDIFGCVTAICRAAPTIREALKVFGQYLPIVQSPVAIELLEGQTIAELRYIPVADYGAVDQAHYQAVLLTKRLLNQLGGPGFEISYVNLNTETRPKDVTVIERILGARFHTAGMNAVGFPARLLDQPIVSSDTTIFRLLSGYLERVENAARTSLVERVEDYIRASLASGTCSAGRCARRMGISQRTLHTRLGESDVRFSDILERQRRELAKLYLAQTGLSLDEVACRLGYSEQSTFGRAFRRWTGLTPQGYQHRIRAQNH